MSEELYDFIEKRVHPRSKNPLINFIERYTNVLHNARYTIDQVINQAGHSSLNTTKGYFVTNQEDLISLANNL